MKKILLITLLFSALFFGCDDKPKKQDVLQQIDLRNKDVSGNSVRTAANPVFSFEYKGKDLNSVTFGDLTDEELQSLIKFEDDEKGFKIVYTKNPKVDGYYFDTTVIYIDGNQNWSTRQTVNPSILNTSEDVVSWVYPFVLPGKTYDFAIQFRYQGVYDFQLFYSVTPAHGLGVVSDLPKSYNSTNYIDFDGEQVKLHDVIPVESSLGVKKHIELFGTSHSDVYWKDFGWFYGTDEEIEEIPEDSAVTVDLSEIIFTTDYDYVYGQFNYTYKIEGFDYCSFNTPTFITEIIENTTFTSN